MESLKESPEILEQHIANLTDLMQLSEQIQLDPLRRPPALNFNLFKRVFQNAYSEMFMDMQEFSTLIADFIGYIKGNITNGVQKIQ